MINNLTLKIHYCIGPLAKHSADFLN